MRHYESLTNASLCGNSVLKIHQKSKFKKWTDHTTESLTNAITYKKGCDNLCTTNNKFQQPALAVSPSLQPLQPPKHGCQMSGLLAADGEPVLLQKLMSTSVHKYITSIHTL